MPRQCTRTQRLTRRRQQRQRQQQRAAARGTCTDTHGVRGLFWVGTVAWVGLEVRALVMASAACLCMRGAGACGGGRGACISRPPCMASAPQWLADCGRCTRRLLHAGSVCSRPTRLLVQRSPVSRQGRAVCGAAVCSRAPAAMLQHARVARALLRLRVWVCAQSAEAW